MTTTQLQMKFEQCKELLLELNIPIPIGKICKKVGTSTRYKKKLGCTIKRTNGKADTYEIIINKNMLHSEDKEIEQVIIHELLHTCPECMNHGPMWKKWADYVNEKTDYEITVNRNVKHLVVDAPYWLLQCPVCGTSKKMYRKPTVQYHCLRDNVVLEPKYIK